MLIGIAAPDGAVIIMDAGVATAANTARLYCHSTGPETEETAIAARLSKPRGHKRLAESQRWIGRLQEKNRGANLVVPARESA